jgi:hypothetical protein
MSTTNPTWDAVTDPVTQALNGMSAQGWRNLHHTRWPGHPGHMLAHVAVGPGGIVVVMVPGPSTHEDAVDVLHEDQACSIASVTALVAPRHRRAVNGILVVPPDSDLPTRATAVDHNGLEKWLNDLEPRLSPLEVVLVSAYLRDKLDPVSVMRADQIPRQTDAPATDAPADQVAGPDEQRPRWWRRHQG